MSEIIAGFAVEITNNYPLWITIPVSVLLILWHYASAAYVIYWIWNKVMPSVGLQKLTYIEVLGFLIMLMLIFSLTL